MGCGVRSHPFGYSARPARAASGPSRSGRPCGGDSHLLGEQERFMRIIAALRSKHVYAVMCEICAVPLDHSSKYDRPVPGDP